MYKPTTPITRSTATSRQKRPTSTDRLTQVAVALAALAIVMVIYEAVGPISLPFTAVAQNDAGDTGR